MVIILRGALSLLVFYQSGVKTKFWQCVVSDFYSTLDLLDADLAFRPSPRMLCNQPILGSTQTLTTHRERRLYRNYDVWWLRKANFTCISVLASGLGSKVGVTTGSRCASSLPYQMRLLALENSIEPPKYLGTMVLPFGTPGPGHIWP